MAARDGWMTWNFSLYGFIYLISSFVTFNNAFFNWRRRDLPGIIWMTTMMSFISGWLFVNFLMLCVVEPQWKFLFLRLGTSFSIIFAGSLYFFVVDYFQIPHLNKRKNEMPFLIIIFILLVIDWTNSLHHLVWTVTVSPDQTLQIHRGILNTIRNDYLLALFGFCCVLLSWYILKNKGWNRSKAYLSMLSCFFPFIMAFVSKYISIEPFKQIALPFGFINMGLLLSAIIFEDLQRLVEKNTDDLKKTIAALQDEITTRQNLENELRKSQDVLAIKLASQSNKLSGLYDLLLFSNENIDYAKLLDRSMEKTCEIMECAVCCFFDYYNDKFLLEGGSAMDLETVQKFQQLPTNWLPAGRDIRADINIEASPDLPPDFFTAGFRSSLSKWVVVQEKQIGMLMVFWKEKRKFSVEEIALYGGLVDGIGLILENTRLRQTAAIAVTLQERRRLARDLHDSVTQSIHSLTLSAQTAQKQINSDPEHLQKTLKHIENSSRQALKEMRLLLFELRLVPTSNINLADSIRNRLDSVEKRAGIQADVIMQPGTEWRAEWEPELFSLTMEALNNALKHAFASHVQVELAGNRDHFSLSIKDDGLGFDPPQAMSGGGMGLKNMYDRCEKLGGTLSIQSSPVHGTTIQIILPDPQAGAAGEKVG
jgi:signal transduction histidine kinase